MAQVTVGLFLEEIMFNLLAVPPDVQGNEFCGTVREKCPDAGVQRRGIVLPGIEKEVG